MAFYIKMVPHWLSVSGQAMQNQAACFSESELVALNRVGMIVGLDSQLLCNPVYHFRWQRTQGVQLLPKSVYRCECVAGHDLPLSIFGGLFRIHPGPSTFAISKPLFRSRQARPSSIYTGCTGRLESLHPLRCCSLAVQDNSPRLIASTRCRWVWYGATPS